MSRLYVLGLWAIADACCLLAGLNLFPVFFGDGNPFVGGLLGFCFSLVIPAIGGMAFWEHWRYLGRFVENNEPE
jgi:hypothetical protein